MMNWLTRRFRKDAGGDSETGVVVIQGRPLRCLVCANTSFSTTQVQFDTPLTSLLDDEAWDRIADCAICTRCGHLHLFAAPAATVRSGTGAADALQALPGAGLVN
jgi:hypothetical protein